jgi:dUTP pyrophosphatase
MRKAKKTKLISMRVEQMPHAQGLDLPAYQTAGAAGLDLQAAVDAGQPLVLEPGHHEMVPTGLKFELPRGMEAQVRPRSGLAAKHGITVLNSPGTIDSDYRGEVQIILINLGTKPFEIRRGERIAQLVVSPYAQVALVAATGLSSTERGAGGFGSTGKAPAVAKSKARAKNRKTIPVATRGAHKPGKKT